MEYNSNEKSGIFINGRLWKLFFKTLNELRGDCLRISDRLGHFQIYLYISECKLVFKGFYILYLHIFLHYLPANLLINRDIDSNLVVRKVVLKI